MTDTIGAYPDELVEAVARGVCASVENTPTFWRSYVRLALAALSARDRWMADRVTF